MDREERIRALNSQIALLPAGGIGTKTVNGVLYHYHRWSLGGQRFESFVPEDELDSLKEKIDRRRELEAEVRSLGGKVSRRKTAAEKTAQPVGDVSYTLPVLLGSDLADFCSPVASWKTREGFGQLMAYLAGPAEGKVFVLYGLRRTGKTTLMRQALLAIEKKSLGLAAFIQVSRANTLAQLNADLKLLKARGIRFVFIDEVTLLDDFIEGAALLPDIFAASGMHVVLSGTDSLGFALAKDEQLYDRCEVLHTTYIPYHEFAEVLGLCGADEYLRYGGTMTVSGDNYAARSPFSSADDAGAYVDTAIAKNIQHSLACYDRGGHFRALHDLYEADELTSAINRVVEDVNHRFTLEVLERDFSSSDLAISANNLRRDRSNPTDILDRVDIAQVTARMKELLEIRDRDQRGVELTDAHTQQIKEYLDLLDLTLDIPVRFLPDVSVEKSRTVICQPGLRYAQVEALIEGLMLDQEFSDLSLAQRNYVLSRIRSEVMGRMLEDVVLLETTLARPGSEVFVLQFAVGEFDMVVFDPKAASCEIFEIKHSDKKDKAQRRHLLDPKKRALCEHRYGPITGTYILYRGPADYEEGVQYVNVEDYLA